MKRRNWYSLAHAEQRALEDAGYTVWVEYPWHWVVSKYESQVKIHVWPTSGKVMAYFDAGATLYSNKDQLVEFVDRAFNPQLRVGMASEDQVEAQKKVQKLKDNFLSDWGEEDGPQNVADIDQI